MSQVIKGAFDVKEVLARAAVDIPTGPPEGGPPTGPPDGPASLAGPAAPAPQVIEGTADAETALAHADAHAAALPPSLAGPAALAPQVIKGTANAETALADAAAALPASLAGPAALAPPPDVTSPPCSEPPRHTGAPQQAAAAAAPAPSALRLPTKIGDRRGPGTGGRQVRVDLGSVEGWGHGSSSLIALPHGMEPAGCIATLALHAIPRDAPYLAATGSGDSTGTVAGGPAAAGTGGRPAEASKGAGGSAATALLFLILKSGKVLRFQARL